MAAGPAALAARAPVPEPAPEAGRQGFGLRMEVAAGRMESARRSASPAEGIAGAGRWPSDDGVSDYDGHSEVGAQPR